MNLRHRCPELRVARELRPEIGHRAGVGVVERDEARLHRAGDRGRRGKQRSELRIRDDALEQRLAGERRCEAECRADRAGRRQFGDLVVDRGFHRGIAGHHWVDLLLRESLQREIFGGDEIGRRHGIDEAGQRREFRRCGGCGELSFQRGVEGGADLRLQRQAGLEVIEDCAGEVGSR